MDDKTKVKLNELIKEREDARMHLRNYERMCEVDDGDGCHYNPARGECERDDGKPCNRKMRKENLRLLMDDHDGKIVAIVVEEWYKQKETNNGR